MKKYFSIEMGSRGEIEIPYITEGKDIKSVIGLRKGKLIEDLKSADMSKGEIKEYMDEWFCTEDYEYGSDVVLGEEESCIYIDMESDLFKNWKSSGGDKFVEKAVFNYNSETNSFDESSMLFNENESEERVWDLLNSFWNGGN